MFYLLFKFKKLGISAFLQEAVIIWKAIIFRVKMMNLLPSISVSLGRFLLFQLYRLSLF